MHKVFYRLFMADDEAEDLVNLHGQAQSSPFF
jgi:hypothetical protein